MYNEKGKKAESQFYPKKPPRNAPTQPLHFELPPCSLLGSSTYSRNLAPKRVEPRLRTI